ncbi:MAG: hypothetical protein P0Y55_03750 [Candidatus Cohnella colombiensis]|uniref:Uncharacterized protein n=1 Tax=Candidatus Cohnella colombiensis TaxID=3121368 RepID=A0AA95JCH7_9BACL|nr:MAG: hypothetical protein P0Y55_03750 [Cohnella sp.]
METFELAELAVAQDAIRHALTFTHAKLVIVTEPGTRLWYVEVDEVNELDVLHHFADAEDIRVVLTGTTIGGRKFEGNGFLHPNPKHRAAAIRGDGELLGYGMSTGA